MSRIMVVDDDEQIRNLLQITLERAGYDVEIARNGRDAIDLFRQSPADLVITDIVMPEQEGLAMILELRKSNPEVSIVAISGGGFADAHEYLNIARAFGARHTFSKPVDQDELLNAVAESLTPE